MSRKTTALAALGGLATLAALTVPATGAGADDACTAWGSLPARVALGPHGATVHTTLRGTAACRGVTADNGATALLTGPGRNDDVPLRYPRFGGSDEATYYASLNRPGTYRVVNGKPQTYDANYVRIPATWHVTSTEVKYGGRLVNVAQDGSGVSATLQSYGKYGWAAETGVRVSLQRRLADGSWRTVAIGRTSGSGRVHIAHGMSSSADYRLAAATTDETWGATRGLRSVGV